MPSPHDPGRRRLLTILAALTAAGVGGATLRWLLDPGRGQTLEAANTSTTSSVVVTATRQPAESSTAAPDSTSPTEPSSTTTSTTTPTTTTADPIIFIPVICREAWGAQPVAGEMEAHDIERLTVHHTAVPLSSVAAAPEQLRGHQRFHQDTRGWPDLAYHYMIDPGGHVYEGRDVAYRGDTATEYDPSGHFLVCIDGDFDSATPNDAQLSSLVAMLAYGAHAYGLDPSGVAGHRDYAKTSCPGDNLYSVIESGWLASQIRERLLVGIPTPDIICGDKGAQLVNQIESGDA